jgi:hypothetical protein
MNQQQDIDELARKLANGLSLDQLRARQSGDVYNVQPVPVDIFPMWLLLKSAWG